ncbi:hypothetical protein SAMN05421823_11970 [Catalinimonas alkaloidigena]|uniref:Uncharacterized protein n=1 Tax=Catalinimonas alkaloidigena TaxID=1075417 RepID=A0A1G9VBF4_9BACT|nr:hypothetical protein [Catalinimonas alkaloidigena]SDM69195.1 hypothetical protein SAMN05421823_11970 [Catalinimonas alkaloidigena]
MNTNSPLFSPQEWGPIQLDDQQTYTFPDGFAGFSLAAGQAYTIIKDGVEFTQPGVFTLPMLPNRPGGWKGCAVRAEGGPITIIRFY